MRYVAHAVLMSRRA